MVQQVGEDLQQIGHYRVRSKIAEGGFGVVYAGHDPRLDRPVAIKVLHPYHASDPSRVARFVREARSAARLNHPGIVQIYDVIQTEGLMALVMEFVQGKSLDVYLRDHPELTLAQKLEIAAQIADTLHTAHEAGIVHRDVKPANVLVEESGRVKLTDFSLARLVDPTMTPLTGEHNVLGTPAYMSPEQCHGAEAVAQSDLYSLGIVIYEMAAGNRPFEAENYLALLRHHTDTPPTPIRLIKPSLPVALDNLIQRCLAKEIKDRPASGAELAQTLRDMVAAGVEEGDASSSKTVELRYPDLTPTPTPMPFTPIPSTATPSPRSAGTPFSPMTPGPMTPGPITPGTMTPLPTPVPAGLTPAPMAPMPESSGTQAAVVVAGRRWLRVALMVCGAAAIAVIGGIVALMLTRSEGGVPRAATPLWSYDNPLLDYVNAPDDNFAYSLHSMIPGQGFRAYVLDLTSQTWHADKAVPPVWHHWLTIVVPETISSDKALMVFTKGLSSAERPLTEIPPSLLALAMTSQSVVAILEGFPRDPVGFHDNPSLPAGTDPDKFAVASFARFVSTGDPTWPIVCPLVKTVVRAMDAVQGYLQDELRLRTPVTGFVLTGEANGWGTWLTGTVDSRVAAIAPIQFDLLNISQQIHHQVAQGGQLSPFLSLFSEMGLMPSLDTPRGEQLLKIIDPYEYRDRVTTPKLLLLPDGSNPFTTVDAAGLYLGSLQGDTYLFGAPNVAFSRSNPFLPQAGRTEAAGTKPGGVEYGLPDFRDTLQVFYHKVLVGKPMPRATWNISTDGTFEVITDEAPAQVRLWLARSDSPQFGFEGEPAAKNWQMEKLPFRSEGVYKGKVMLSDEAYTAFYVELVYPSILGINYSLTTPTTILNAQQKPSQVSPQ